MLKKIIINVFVILTLVGLMTWKLTETKNELKNKTYIMMTEKMNEIEEKGGELENHSYTTIRLTPIGFKCNYEFNVENYLVNGKATIHDDFTYNWIDIVLNNDF